MFQDITRVSQMAKEAAKNNERVINATVGVLLDDNGQIVYSEVFDELLAKVDAQSTTYLLKAEVRQNSERKKVAEGVTNEDKNTVKKASPKRVAKIGRNDKCPCGSGKKYKQCCGK